MGAIKRNITDISNLKRGAAQVVKVYRGANLVWTNAPAASATWLTNGLNMSLDETVTTNYVTNGLNKNLK
jgi:hypothetical protein